MNARKHAFRAGLVALVAHAERPHPPPARVKKTLVPPVCEHHIRLKDEHVCRGGEAVGVEFDHLLRKVPKLLRQWLGHHKQLGAGREEPGQHVPTLRRDHHDKIIVARHPLLYREQQQRDERGVLVVHRQQQINVNQLAWARGRGGRGRWPGRTIAAARRALS